MESRRTPDTESVPPPPDADHLGWDSGPPPTGRRSAIDFSALFVLLDAIRRAVPRELQGQLTALIREALLTLRSLIDWYLDRLERPARDPRVEDIPID